MKKYIVSILIISLLTAGCRKSISKKEILPDEELYFKPGWTIIGSPSGEYNILKIDSSGSFIDPWNNNPSHVIKDSLISIVNREHIGYLDTVWLNGEYYIVWPDEP